VMAVTPAKKRFGKSPVPLIWKERNQRLLKLGWRNMPKHKVISQYGGREFARGVHRVQRSVMNGRQER
jgi:hypothetical protein